MNDIKKIDHTMLAFLSDMMDVKARMLETAARLANESDSIIRRAEVLDEILASCAFIDSMILPSKVVE